MLVKCAETMTGPYPYVEERLVFLFKRFGECGHAVPGANMLLSRVLQTKAIVASSWSTPSMRGAMPKPSGKIDSVEDKLGSPAMEYDTLSSSQGRNQALYSSGKSNPLTISINTNNFSGSPSNNSRNFDSPQFGKSPIEDLGVRDISNLKGKLTAVANSSSSSTFRKFLTVQPTPAVPYTRFTRLIREALRQGGYTFSGNEAAYLLRAVDPQGDGVIFGSKLKSFLGVSISPRQPAWGSPAGQIKNSGKNRNVRDAQVHKHAYSRRSEDHTNSKQVRENTQKLNAIRAMLQKSLNYS